MLAHSIQSQVVQEQGTLVFVICIRFEDMRTLPIFSQVKETSRQIQCISRSVWSLKVVVVECFDPTLCPLLHDFVCVIRQQYTILSEILLATNGWHQLFLESKPALMRYLIVRLVAHSYQELAQPFRALQKSVRLKVSLEVPDLSGESDTVLGHGHQLAEVISKHHFNVRVLLIS